MQSDLSDRPFILLCHPKTGSRLWVQISPYCVDEDLSVVDEWVMNWVALDYKGWGVPMGSDGKIIYNERPPEEGRGPTIYEET